jgi:2-oxoisovalerate dehydrogenase E1 component
MTDEELLDAYRRMARIREFEEAVAVLYREGKIPGFVHLSVGQEASAVGATFWLRSADVITSTHRGHGHTLAKGLDVRSMFAELMGRETGTCRGRGGSMHIADPSAGIFGANGIVAAGLPIAVGAAWALRHSDAGGVVVAFFGDGAVSQGAFHESVNLAALWRLPIVFFCENNGFSEFSRSEDQSPVSLEQRALGYGLDFVSLDGDDVEAVATGMKVVIQSVRDGDQPVIVEARTHRVHGHYEGDQQKYRSPEDLQSSASADPLRISEASLVSRGVARDELDEIRQSAKREMQSAIESAALDPSPDPVTLLDDVYATQSSDRSDRHVISDRDDIPSKYSRAIRKALDDALFEDSCVYLAGIDVGGGNVFGLTRGLSKKFPGRVLDTPISETALMGLAVGSAMAGQRPVVELMYLDFIGVCLDQIMNQAAKLRFMTGGKASLPLVVRTQFGAGRSSGSQHSQSLEALLAHIPGLKVVMPYTAHDAYGLLREAIDDDSPVIFIENRLLYEKSDPSNLPPSSAQLGKASIAREGTDATIVSWSRAVGTALQAADELSRDGIDVEVLDLRTIVPLDRSAILTSLAKTGRLCVVHDAVTEFGVGAEIAALAGQQGFWLLDAPVARIGAAFAPAPYAPELETAWMPSVAEVVSTVRDQVNLAPGASVGKT